MAQITIYLDDEVTNLVDQAVRSAGVSKSRWIADAIRSRIRKEWPDSVRALAGAWPEFPTAQQIRKQSGRDTPREKF
jgi:hypothetical protein